MMTYSKVQKRMNIKKLTPKHIVMKAHKIKGKKKKKKCGSSQKEKSVHLK